MSAEVDGVVSAIDSTSAFDSKSAFDSRVAFDDKDESRDVDVRFCQAESGMRRGDSTNGSFAGLALKSPRPRTKGAAALLLSVADR
jgi:hypothetical protein